MKDNAKVSIISPSRNTGRFAKETIESIMAQTHTDWEHIVIDGLSTDETLDVIRNYPHIRWISEKDSGPDEAFRKGLAMAKGEYVMFCAISDGYLDKNWLRKCINVLDNDPEIALVWGLPQYMTEDGVLEMVAYDHFFDVPPPQGRDFLYYWLKTHFWLPEGNFCVRKNVMEDCYPVINPNNIGHECEFLTFNYNFNTSGYLPYFIPVVANYGRIHFDAGGQHQKSDGRMAKWLKKYHQDVDQYQNRLIKREVVHKYRNGSGLLMSGGFNAKQFSLLERTMPRI